MIRKFILIILIGLFGLAASPDWFSSSIEAQALPPINYDIVYVRSPRPGNNTNTFWSDAITPLFLDPGADLVLLHPNGSEEVLFNGGADGSVMAPYISYDARSVVFTYFPNVRNVNPQRGLNGTYALSFIVTPSRIIYSILSPLS